MTPPQGLTLVPVTAQHEPLSGTEATASVHFSAQPETFVHMRPPNVAHKVLTSSRKVDMCSPQKALTLSRTVDRCKPLPRGHNGIQVVHSDAVQVVTARAQGLTLIHFSA